MSKSVEARATEWLAGSDTGASSKAIARHMLGLAHDRWGPEYPHDNADFGRCFRLLEMIPEWRDRMPEMARHSPQWKALVGVWSELESLQRADRGAELYKRMRAVLDAPERADPGMVRVGPGLSIRFGPIGKRA